MQTTSLTLLARLKTGSDADAWNRFVAIYSPLLYHGAVRMGLSDQDALDVVQEVLTSLTQELPRFEYNADRKNFRGWLKTMTANKCRDQYRRRAIRAGHEQAAGREGPQDFSAVEIFSEAEYRKWLVQQAMRVMQSEFEERTWRACWVTTVEERSAKDAAVQLGMTEAAVYMAKSRVLRRLRDELAGLWE